MTGEPVLPAFTTEDAERIVAEHFGIRGTASSLPSYIDCNFRIEVADPAPDTPAQFVLKIANVATPRAELEFECLAMESLRFGGRPVRTPRVQRSGGRDLIEIEDGAGTKHWMRLVDFLPGMLLAHAGTPSDALLRDLGRGLGHLDRGLKSVAHPAQHRELPWDLARAAWIADHLAVVGGGERRAWVEHALLQYQAQIAPLLHLLPSGIIHNDANDYNVVVDGDRLAGVFDFGDMVRTARVFEPVIAATYAAFHRPDDPLEAIAQVAAGYVEVIRLVDPELDLFHYAIAARLAVSVVSSAKTAAADPDHTYASVSEQGAWALLERLHTMGPAPLRDLLRERCGRPAAEGSDIDPQRLIEARRRSLGPSLSLSYDEPLAIISGHQQYLYATDGRAYLDGVNNVCHVGHCRDEVVEALTRQAGILNTNTRYLHDAIVEYAERLVATLPDPLEVCWLVCSGSEANELALRMARAATGRHDVVVLDHAYHGNTSSLVELSPYKFDGRGGSGRPEHVTVVPAPDPYRNAAGIEGRQFAEQTVGTALAERAAQRPVAALFAESLLGCGGQVVPPPGYLARAFELIREHGGVAVADEVQVGFGRVGTHLWAFDAQGAQPDIVTMGKPIGNGHPMGAVVTTRAIAERFANGMEYFNTFGGNPVSCRVGLAVLDVLEREGLVEHADRVGRTLMTALQGLAEVHPLIGDVRGMGLFIGVELVTDRSSKQPAAAEAAAVVQHCRAHGVLLSTDGPRHNVIKIKPPLPFDEIDVKLLVGALDRALTSVAS